MSVRSHKFLNVLSDLKMWNENRDIINDHGIGCKIDEYFLPFRDQISDFIRSKDTHIPMLFKIPKVYNFIVVPRTFNGYINLLDLVNNNFYNNNFSGTVNFIILESGARCNISANIERHTSSCSFIFIKDNAKLNYYTFIPKHKHAHNLLVINNFVLSKGARLNHLSAIFSGASVMAENRIMLAGKGCTAYDGSAFFSWDECSYNFLNRVIHASENSVSMVEVRGAMKDNSKAMLNAKATINTNASDSDSSVRAFALLLSDNCSFNSTPSLEVLSDKVKATHSAYTGTIDEEKMFYLKTRGLNERLAKILYVSGFLGHMLRRDDKAFKSKIYGSVCELI